MSDWILNEGPRWIILVLWLAANALLFGLTFVHYNEEKQFFYLRRIIGDSLAWARGSAACLNLNCLLVLLPVCRNLISYLRGGCMCCRRNVRRQLDKSMTFHKYFAYAICVFTAIHVGAHCFNLERFILAHNHPDPNLRPILAALSNPSLAVNRSSLHINPVSSKDAHATIEVFKIAAGVTGAVITLALIVIVSSSTELIRRSYYEVFWFTHHLFVIFYIGLVLHGIQRIIRSQTNLSVHDPEVCYNEAWGAKNQQCPIPTFEGGAPKTWIWVLVPMILYVVERIIRFIRSMQHVSIKKVVSHPSRVYELQLHKAGFKAQPGQYIYLQCNKVSRVEWHPFTLTSAPGDDCLMVHIRRVGDWTEKLAVECGVDDSDVKPASSLPRPIEEYLGKFNTGMTGSVIEPGIPVDIFRYQVDILIGTGIGITPFASVLKHIWYKMKSANFDMKLKRVYLFWVCPNMDAFEWLQSLLSELETQLAEHGKAGFLVYQIYLTRGWDQDTAANIMLHADDTLDAVTRLHQKTQFGRPQWHQIFKQISDSYQGISIGVFCCGPPQLSTQLHKLCNRFSSTARDGTRFFYNKESF